MIKAFKNGFSVIQTRCVQRKNKIKENCTAGLTQKKKLTDLDIVYLPQQEKFLKIG